MSRVGKQQIKLPEEVEINIQNNEILVKGPKGELRQISNSVIRITIENGILTLENTASTKAAKSLHGLYRALIANMIQGVTVGFTKELELIGVGYKVTKENENLIFSLGYSHPISINPPQGIVFEINGPTKVLVRGIDKQRVGMTSANLRNLRRPDAYKGKGVRYLGEIVKTKPGKSVK